MDKNNIIFTLFRKLGKIGLIQVRESIRGSRSFDEGVLSEIKKNFPDAKVAILLLFFYHVIL